MIQYVLHVLPYIGYSALITAVCLLFYRLLLQRETFFFLNRWFFLGCLVFSFLLPLVPVPGGWSVKATLMSEITGVAGGVELASTPNPALAQSSVRVQNMVPAQRMAPMQNAVPAQNVTAPHNVAPLRNAAAAQHVVSAQKPAPSQNVAAAQHVGLTQDVAPGTGASAPPQAAPSPAASRHSVPTDVADQDPAAGPFSGELAGATTPAESTVSRPVGFTLKGFLQGLFCLYICGVAVFGINLVLQFVTLFMRVRHRPIIRDGWFRIVETVGNGAPCSFGRYIFINPGLYDEKTYEQILAHEKIHVQQGHSIDIMLAELCLVVQWFNPFAWRYRKALEDNLEFLTDAAVIKNPRTDATHYQMSLLRVSAPHLPLRITSNYNQSLLKKRIIMMHIKKSSVRTTWKYFFLPPLLMGMVCVFNATIAQRQPLQARINAPTRDTLPQEAPPPANAPMNAPTNAPTNTPMNTPMNVPANAPMNTPMNAPVDVPANAPEKSAPVNSGEALPNADNALNLSIPLNLNLSVDAKVKDIHVVPTPTPDMNFNMDFQFDTRDTGDNDLRSGTWMATIKGEEVELMLKSANGDNTSSSHFKKSEFSSLPTDKKADFTLTRQAGTLYLNGRFDGNDGFGHYSFKENPDFVAFLKKEGVTWTNDNRMMGAFFAGVTREYVETLASAGYTSLPLHDLIALSAMKISPDYIKSWKDMGYPDLPVHDVIALKSMNVDRVFVKQLEDAGFTHPAIHDVIAAKSMNIDAAYMQSWKQYGFTNPSIHDLVGLKSLGIDGAYLKTWKDMGYTNLEPHDLMGLKSVNVDEAYLQGMKAAGLDHLEPHQLMGLKSLGVDGNYIQKLKAAGFEHLEPHDVMAFKSMNIDGKYVQEFGAIGYRHLEPHDLFAFKSMGITPEFIKGFADIGFKDIPPHTLIELKSTGVTSDYIVAMKNKGFDSKDLQQYVKLKNFK